MKKAEYTSTMQELWGKQVASKGFSRIPSLLIKFKSHMGINNNEFVIISALIMYQRNTKPAFPRMITLANIAGLDEEMTRNIVYGLKERGLLTIEPTKNRKGNYIDLRLLRNRLSELAPSLIGIDTSSKNSFNKTDASNQVNASIPDSIDNRDDNGSGHEYAKQVIDNIRKKKNQI